MVMTLAVLILLCSIFGIVYVTTQIKENKMAKMEVNPLILAEYERVRKGIARYREEIAVQ